MTSRSVGPRIQVWAIECVDHCIVTGRVRYVSIVQLKYRRQWSMFRNTKYRGRRSMFTNKNIVVSGQPLFT